jgi:predicted phage baseplate assembly protein
MPLEAPTLDDRRFDEIVAEAKSLIPRYAPEWTDHNESDPGITLVELFAWMTEMLIYRVNQIPERNYRKFLALLGVRPNPAQPARAELTFTLARPDVDSLVVPQGTQVGVAGAAEPTIFETEQALVAIGASLAGIYVSDGFSVASAPPATETDPAEPFQPFGPAPREGAALLLGFDTPRPTFTSAVVDLAVLVAERDAAARRCDLDGMRVPPPAITVWEFFDGKAWQPVDLERDETRAFTQSGHVVFHGPGSAVPKVTIPGISATLHWFRCRLARTTYEEPPQIERVLTNTVVASQAITVQGEIVGGSDGSPGQRFRLANAPVVVEPRPETIPARVGSVDGRSVRVTSVRLEVQDRPDSDDPASFEVWQEVDDFYESGPDDAHFLFDRATGDVQFGDGRRGRIPTALPANPTGNVIARLYRYGGGVGGNAPAGAIMELQTSPEGVDTVTNHRPASGGAAEETVAEAKLRAPRELQSRSRAVTAADYEALATEAPGAHVARARALPLTHPRFPDAQIPGVVTVVVVPGVPGPKPVPNEATLTAVCEYLNEHRTITAELYVVPPTYREVRISGEIVVEPDQDLAEVKRAVEERLDTFFHPLHGGRAGQGWEFGRTIFYSEVYREVFTVRGVQRIRNNQLTITLDDEPEQPCRDVPIGEGNLLYTGTHRLQFLYDEDGRS